MSFTNQLVGVTATAALAAVAPHYAGLATGASSGSTPSFAATAAPTVAVYPTPGDRFELPRTQITFRRIAPGEIGTVHVVGSTTGVHDGRLAADSDGKGASFIPNKPFAPGETVTVTTGLSVVGGRDGTFSFQIERPRPTLSAMPLPRVPGGVQRFRSNPGLKPPSVVVTRDAAPASDGDIFVAPQFGPQQDGPMILNPRGRLVWFKPFPLSSKTLVTDFRVQRLFGQTVLTWWQGSMKSGSGRGYGVILDQHYKQIASVQAGNGVQMDLHEFLVTNQGDAWIIALAPMRLAGVRRTVENCIVQEIDIRTGLVLFQWDAMDHVPPAYSYVWGPRTPGHVLDPWHVNSISLDASGNPVISMRNTSAVYDVNRSTGAINWELGGKHSSFRMGPGTTTAFQHAALMHRGNQLTIFDDGGGPPRVHSQSRGIRVAINTKARTAKLIQQYRHSPPVAANFEGNLQPLPNGNVFLGWGQAPFFSQDTASGKQDFSAHFTSATASYRAYRFQWRAQAATKPALAVSAGKRGSTKLYASWNGSTDVATWRVLTGERPLALRPGQRESKDGFDTVITIHSHEPYVAVQALGAKGRVLATSPVKRRPK
jgi:hypothetical protein